MLLGTQFKNGLGTNPAMGRAPQRGFYMYFPRFKELGFIPEARIEAAIKQMENSPEIDNACVLGLRAALNDAVFPFQKVFFVCENENQMVYIHDVPHTVRNGMVEFTFNDEVFMEAFPTAKSFQETDETFDWDMDWKKNLKRARNRQFNHVAKGFGIAKK